MAYTRGRESWGAAGEERENKGEEPALDGSRQERKSESEQTGNEMETNTKYRAAAAPLRFAELVMDPGQRRIQRGDETIALMPKPWAVLYYLASRPAQLVTKDELFEAVWPETIVSEAALSSCIKEIRRALDDPGRRPRYLQTVYGHGYRFIAAVAPADASPRHPRAPLPTGLVGRATELAQLQQWWQWAGTGQRQVGFVTGEAGIGKTTLVSAFVQRLSAVEPVLLGQGQCIDQYGQGEAYRPVLAALSQLSQGPAGDRLVELLWAQAPSWLLHLPALLSPAERKTLAAQYQGLTQTQALRELADVFDRLATHQPVVLVFEDLHWSDTATLAFVSVLARQSTSARVLVLGTYRPVDVIVTAHPVRQLKAELELHGLCDEIALEYLNPAEVQTYMTRRVGEAGTQLAAELHTRSGGNPLFLVNLVDYLERQTGTEAALSLREQWEAMATVVPDRVQELIVVQAEQLTTPARLVIEAASVNGVTFFPTLVAAGLGQERDAVEEVCEDLEREGRFVHALDDVTWPDGTVETPYGFQHALYRETLYQRVATGRRRRLHQAIGTRLEAGYGEQVREVAAELALHFEQGREVEKAVQYYQLTGETGLQRSAHREAVFQVQKGLALVETLPQSPVRLTQELRLLTMLVPGLSVVKGHTTGEVEHALLRTRELCEQAGDTQLLFFVLIGLAHLYHGRGTTQQAHEYAEACLALATTQQQATVLLGAHNAMGMSTFYQGTFAQAQTHWEQRGVLYNPEQHHTYLVQYGFNPVVDCLLGEALIRWLHGYPDQAARQIEYTLSLEHELTHLFTRIFTHFFAAVCYQFLRDEHALATQIESCIALASQQGFPHWIAVGTALRGWSQVTQGDVSAGITEMRRGMAAMQEVGAMSHWTNWLTLLAEAVGQMGDDAQALEVIEEAALHREQSGERFYEAETWRIKGELLLAQESQTSKGKGQKLKAAAETCFQKALGVARQQEAKAFELRAAMSLSRLWQQQGKNTPARALLAPMYDWFTEGFDTPDLQEAKALLDTL